MTAHTNTQEAVASRGGLGRVSGSIEFIDPRTLTGQGEWRPKRGRTMLALGYGRVSALDAKGVETGTAKSVAEQHRNYNNTCERNGWQPKWWFDDGAASGSRNHHKRTAFDETKRVLATGAVDVFVVWSSSRAARDFAVTFNELLPILQATNTRYAYGRNVYDPNDADDVDRILDDAKTDAKYAKRISQDVTRANVDRALQGAPHGRVLYGYRRVWVDGREGRVPNNVCRDDNGELLPEAAIVVEAVRRFLAGASVRSIATWLDTDHPLPARTVASGRNAGRVINTGWERSRVRDMLTNPGYAGLRFYKGNAVQYGTWEPLITVADHEAVKARLAATATSKTRGNVRRHLLAGVARCGVCDTPMRSGYTQPRKGERYHVYQCPHGHMAINEAKADQAVRDALLAGIGDQYAAIDPAKSPEAIRTDTAIAELRLQIDTWTERMLAGTLDADLAEEWCTKATVKLRAMQAERDAAAAAAISVPTTVAELVDANDKAAAWEAFTVEQRVAILRAMCTIIINPTTAAAGVFDAERIVVTPLHAKRSRKLKAVAS